VTPDKPAGTGVGAGTEGGRPTGPRASDADRDRFAAELHEHFAEGRLSLEELQRRLDLVFAAQTLVDLYELTSDLPHPGPQLPRGLRAGRVRRPVTRKRGWWPFG
jgi:hypothetical protein